jgi:SulP family sulfate permease
MGGVLAALGADYVITWLWDARARMTRLDHLFVITIGLTAFVVGFLTAIVVGIAIAIALFAVRYSRVDVAHRVYSIATTSSSIERSPEHRRVLDADGRDAIVIEVRGFLFFGTATRLFQLAEQVIAEQDAHFVVLDLTGMTGADSSLLAAYQRFERATSSRDLVVLLAGVPEHLRRIVDVALSDATHTIQHHDSLDTAVQWCEDEILAMAGLDPDTEEIEDFEQFLTDLLGSRQQAHEVLRHTRSVRLHDGDVLVATGDEAPGLFVLERGRLDAVLETNGSRTRLRRMLPGAVIGEISLYRQGRVTATVVSVGESSVRHIPIDELTRIETEDPTAAAAIHRFSASVLSSRVLHAERTLRSG